MSVYYNEIDPFAAAWLKELMTDGHIPEGEIDTRDIRDVYPDDLRAFTACHFFAGIGGWALALRLGGWPDDRTVWTGSCPCQPFSAAGKGGGAVDERNLWWAWFHLIDCCRPPVLIGEQVEAAIKFGWLDLVHDDLEGIGYAVAPVGLPAASVGAFHIRQRLWFVAEPGSGGLRRGREPREDTGATAEISGEVRQQRFRADDRADGTVDRLAVAEHAIGRTLDEHRQDGRDRENDRRSEAHGESGTCDGYAGDTERAEDVALANGDGTRRGDVRRGGLYRQLEAGRVPDERQSTDFWDDVLWLPCRDGKARPTQPGLQPLAHGVSNRVGTLRGAGNAIVPEVAQAFIESYLEVSQ